MLAEYLFIFLGNFCHCIFDRLLFIVAMEPDVICDCGVPQKLKYFGFASKVIRNSNEFGVLVCFCDCSLVRMVFLFSLFVKIG